MIQNCKREVAKRVYIKEGKNGIHAMGYINVVERYSMPIDDKVKKEKYIEKVRRGEFRNALKKGVPADVFLDLSHDKTVRGTMSDKTIQKLYEDNIGLYADVYTEDAELVEKGLNGDLVGWSYGMSDFDGEYHVLPTEVVQKFADVSDVTIPEIGVHNVTSLELASISLIDRTAEPTSRTSLTVRAHEDIWYGGALITEPHIIRRQPQKYIYFDEKYGHLLNAK